MQDLKQHYHIFSINIFFTFSFWTWAKSRRSLNVNKGYKTGSASHYIAASRTSVVICISEKKSQCYFTIKVWTPKTNSNPAPREVVGLSEAGGSEACSRPLHGAVRLNSVLFVWATLADLDRLGPERLFLSDTLHDKSVCEIVFLFSEIQLQCSCFFFFAYVGGCENQPVIHFLWMLHLHVL